MGHAPDRDRVAARQPVGAILIVGALLGAGLGVVAGSALGEADVQRGELLVATIGLGTAGGGLLGSLFGNAVPRWKRSYS